MKDWGFAQTHPSQEMAQLHLYSIKKVQPDCEVEFTITVKEYITPKEPTMHFFAQTDKMTNQKTAPLPSLRLGKNHAGSAFRMRESPQPVPVRGAGNQVRRRGKGPAQSAGLRSGIPPRRRPGGRNCHLARRARRVGPVG